MSGSNAIHQLCARATSPWPLTVAAAYVGEHVTEGRHRQYLSYTHTVYEQRSKLKTQHLPPASTAGDPISAGRIIDTHRTYCHSRCECINYGFPRSTW
jgi:hypothetical protein